RCWRYWLGADVSTKRTASSQEPCAANGIVTALGRCPNGRFPDEASTHGRRIGSTPVRSPSPSLLAALLTSVASFVPSTALGQGCPVVVTGEEHSAWRAATSDLEDALGEGPGDC